MNRRHKHDLVRAGDLTQEHIGTLAAFFEDENQTFGIHGTLVAFTSGGLEPEKVRVVIRLGNRGVDVTLPLDADEYLDVMFVPAPPSD